MSKEGVVNIHGKEYQTVALRVKNFRGLCPNHTLQTEIVSRDEDCVVMKASILNEEGRVIATGHSEEYRGSSTINKTSALENSETSAIGRALAAFGMGGTEFATADEVARAITGQKGQATSVAGRVWETMTEEERKFLQGLADQVRESIQKDGGLVAMKFLEEQNLDADEKVAIWSRFDSKERAAMEPHKRPKKVA